MNVRKFRVSICDGKVRCRWQNLIGRLQLEDEERYFFRSAAGGGMFPGHGDIYLFPVERRTKVVKYKNSIVKRAVALVAPGRCPGVVKATARTIKTLSTFHYNRAM